MELWRKSNRVFELMLGWECVTVFEVRYQDENIWLTQKMLSVLYDAVHGHTAAELILERANSEREHMGLTTWRDAPDGNVMFGRKLQLSNRLSPKSIELQN